MGELKIDDSRASGGFREASVTVDGERHQVFIERADGPLSADSSDPFVLATLLLFMQRGEPLHVSGCVSRRLLIGLEEWQRAWCRWKPSTYAPIEVTVDEVLVGYPTSSRAVTSFTGGVDSTYTVQRHVTGAAGNAVADLQAGLFVHGFDIPLDDRQGFDAACRRSARYLAQVDVELVVIKTNLRSLGQDWPDQHGLAVAAMLTCLAPEYGVGLIASTQPYHSLDLRAGSNPMTDHLMSSGMMDIRYDGAEATRAEKVRALLADPEATAQLRFCWQTEPHDQNCGVCAKCIRTACTFMAFGVRDARCLDRWPTAEEIRTVRIPTLAYANGFIEIQELAAANGQDMGDDWYRSLSDAVEANSHPEST